LKSAFIPQITSFKSLICVGCSQTGRFDIEKRSNHMPRKRASCDAHLCWRN